MVHVCGSFLLHLLHISWLLLDSSTVDSFCLRTPPLTFLRTSTLQRNSLNDVPVDSGGGDDEDLVNRIVQVSEDEYNFIDSEAERSGMLMGMQREGFSSEQIENTVELSVLEPENIVMEASSGEGTTIIEDYETRESHKFVERDEETGEIVRHQNVFVDEHDCIGCYNCANVAPGTFFMEQEYGRARGYEQWGDSDEDVQTAIACCPVDCIHYVPFEELKALEESRRDQVINFKARLVGQSEDRGVGNAHRIGSAVEFTAQPIISSNKGSRCNNCPSKGCKDCPMYGVGSNPVFKEREEKRLARIAKKKFLNYVKDAEKRVDL